MGEQTLRFLGALQDDSFDASIHLGWGVEPNVGHLVRHGVVALMANARQHRDLQFADGTHEGIVIELGHVVDDTTTADDGHGIQCHPFVAEALQRAE